MEEKIMIIIIFRIMVVGSSNSRLERTMIAVRVGVEYRKMRIF